MPIRFGIILALLILHSPGAQAALGEGLDSLEMDRQAYGGAPPTLTMSPRYHVYEIRTPTTVLREYVAMPSQLIFAITWKGRIHPNLARLLSSHWSEFQQESGRNPHGPGHRHHRMIKTSRTIVEHWGHMRSLQGRAYDPTTLPEGVTVNEIN